MKRFSMLYQKGCLRWCLCFCLSVGLLIGMTGCDRRLPEAKITLKSSEWDSLSHALGIDSYFLNIDAPGEVNRLVFELDIYEKGELRKTVESMTTNSTGTPIPIKADVALHFLPKEKDESDVKLAIVLKGSSGHGTCYAAIPANLLPDGGGRTFTALQNSPKPYSRTPVCAFIRGAKSMGLSGSNDYRKIIEHHPDATVLVGYLRLD